MYTVDLHTQFHATATVVLYKCFASCYLNDYVKCSLSLLEYLQNFQTLPDYVGNEVVVHRDNFASK